MKNVLSISLDYESFKGKMAVMKSIEESVAFRFNPNMLRGSKPTNLYMFHVNIIYKYI
jgi:hypothetical protein